MQKKRKPESIRLIVFILSLLACRRLSFDERDRKLRGGKILTGVTEIATSCVLHCDGIVRLSLYVA